MRQLWHYRQFRVGFTALILLIAILLTQYLYPRMMQRIAQWSSLGSDSDLVETQATITAVQRDEQGSVIQLQYTFTVADAAGNLRTYTNRIGSNDCKVLCPRNSPLQVQGAIPISYVPDAPEFSLPSRSENDKGGFYSVWLGWYILFGSIDKALPWIGSILVGTIALVILLLQGVKFLRHILVSRVSGSG